MELERRSSTLRSDLRNGLVDCGAFSVMVGIGEAYLAAFALALGMGEVLAGLAASVPMLVGSLLQLVTPRGVRHLGSLRRWVVLCASLQAMSFVPLVVGALLGEMPAVVLFAVAALYWATGQAAGPAWNTWMEHLIPKGLRPRYFAGRNRVAHAAVLTGLLTGGLTLSSAEARGSPVLGFAVIFALAALARMTSARFLARQSEERPAPSDLRPVPLGSLLRRFGRGSEGRLVTYMIVVQVAVQISATFFSSFMLGELGMSYDTYMLLLAASSMTRIFSLLFLGPLAKRFGARPVLWIGGVGIVPLAMFWVFFDSLGWLLVGQVFAGIAWAGYELGTQLLTMEMIRREERTSVLTFFNLANAAALAFGALLGGTLLQRLGQDRDAYSVIFVLSTLGRAGSVLLLLRVAKTPVHLVRLAWSLVAVRPSAGVIERPIDVAEDEP